MANLAQPRPTRNKSPQLEDGVYRSVYDGRDRLGHVVQHGREFVAYDRQRRPLGVFDDMHPAATAIWRASKGAAP